MISLPVLDEAPQRPVYAQGPRSLSSVRLLRISVTDRCNLRCVYCMPAEGVSWMAAQADLLTPADFEAVARAAVSIGVNHIKLTGGEPTVRSDLVDIARRVKALGVEDISLTTNGLLFGRYADSLKQAGVDRVTFSCDSLDPERYRRITSGGDIEQFWQGVRAATDAGYTRLKLNVVVLNGFNDDEVADFAALTIERDWTVRFIEYMPLGESVITMKDPDQAIVDNCIVKARIAERYGELIPVQRNTEAGVGPAEIHRINGARGRLGFISAMSQPFCETCNRLRLTAIGELRSCLFDGGEVDLLPALRPKPDYARLVDLFRECVVLKPEVHSGRGDRAMSQLGG